MDLYLLLVSNVVHYIPSLCLEHQTGELPHIFMHCFVHSHHQKKTTKMPTDSKMLSHSSLQLPDSRLFDTGTSGEEKRWRHWIPLPAVRCSSALFCPMTDFHMKGSN